MYVDRIWKIISENDFLIYVKICFDLILYRFQILPVFSNILLIYLVFYSFTCALYKALIHI